MNKRLGFLALIMVLCTVGLAGATTIFTVPIHNTQSVATHNPSDQMIFFDPSNALFTGLGAAGLGNVRFSQGSTPYYSWCESGCNASSSNAVFWVLIPTTINAHTTIDINMTFGATSQHYDGVFAGEAPNLSSTYGQYDNGASVFLPLYTNFAGTSTPSGFSTSGGTQNNGYATTGGGDAYMITTATYGLNASQILDVSMFNVSAGGGGNNQMVGYVNQGAVGGGGGGSDSAFWTDGSGHSNGVDSVADGYANNFGTLNLNSGNHYFIMSDYWGNNTASTFTINYTNQEKLTPHTPQSALKIGIASQGTLPTDIRWLRLRFYPPNGVMPSFNFTPYVPPITTTTTTSTTTIPKTQDVGLLKNATAGTGLNILLLGFSIVPYFAYILLVLFFGIAYVRTERYGMGFLAAAIGSYGIFAIETAYNTPITILSIGILIIVSTLAAITLWLEMHTKPAHP